jgi:hypothetical protein
VSLNFIFICFNSTLVSVLMDVEIIMNIQSQIMGNKTVVVYCEALYKFTEGRTTKSLGKW